MEHGAGNLDVERAQMRAGLSRFKLALAGGRRVFARDRKKTRLSSYRLGLGSLVLKLRAPLVACSLAVTSTCVHAYEA
jgi:hypothetical protein